MIFFENENIKKMIIKKIIIYENENIIFFFSDIAIKNFENYFHKIFCVKIFFMYFFDKKFFYFFCSDIVF